jgi:ribosomal protein S18 acetylase RimI-like enzyme
MTARSSRAYAGSDDLRRMQAVVARAAASTSLRVGDLAWLARHHTHRELSLDIRLWESRAGQLLGFTFLTSKGGFIVFVVPGADDGTLIDEMLAVVEEAAARSVAAGDPPVSLSTYGIDLARSAEDRSLAAALERHGFTMTASTGGVLRRRLDQLPEPPAIPGYRLGSVRSAAQVLGRVEAQRAAFAPSDLTLEKYQRVRRTWPYRPGLDRIVMTADDVVVSFCTAWLDEENAAGLLEPVGTHPAHQRRGLAKAVCVDALRALGEAGARTAQVGFVTDAAYATYRAIGFQRSGTDLEFRRDVR